MTAVPRTTFALLASLTFLTISGQATADPGPTDPASLIQVATACVGMVQDHNLSAAQAALGCAAAAETWVKDMCSISTKCLYCIGFTPDQTGRFDLAKATNGIEPNPAGSTGIAWYGFGLTNTEDGPQPGTWEITTSSTNGIYCPLG
jgi:hypothetical protein